MFSYNSMHNFNPGYNVHRPELLAFKYAWIHYAETGAIDTRVIQRVIAASWLQSSQLGINPLSTELPTNISQDKLNERIEKNEDLINIALPYLELLYQLSIDSNCKVDFIDSEGYILLSITAQNSLEDFLITNSVPGANRRIESIGTNSVGLAIQNKKPYQVIGAEHYMQIFHPYACSSAPILDSSDKIAGLVSITGRCEESHPHLLKMVYSTAKAIEHELEFIRKNKTSDNDVANGTKLSEAIKSTTIFGKRNSMIIIKEEHEANDDISSEVINNADSMKNIPYQSIKNAAIQFETIESQTFYDENERFIKTDKESTYEKESSSYRVALPRDLEMRMLSIGKMSELNHVPIQTLRYYDKINLLKPLFIDQSSNYRYYDIKQSAMLDLILYFKNLGIRLDSIKDLCDKKDVSELIKILQEQNNFLSRTIKDINQMKRAISRSIYKYKEYIEGPKCGTLQIQHIPMRKIFRFDSKINIYENSLLTYEYVLRQFKQIVISNDLPIIYFSNIGTIFRKEMFDQDKFVSTEFFVFVDDELESEAIEIIPENNYVCIWCDSFDKEKEYALKLFEHIKDKNYEIIGDYICEVIADLPVSFQEERQMFIKLQVPIKTQVYD